jgi:spore coat protein U-like protein
MKTIAIIFTALVMLIPTAGWGDACKVSTTNISFGAYNIFDTAPRDSTGTITVQCPSARPGALSNVVIKMSTGGSGTFSNRQMIAAGGAYRLNYNIFTDPGRAMIWGDGSGGSSALSRTVDKATPWTATFYGRIPARQNVTPGSYSDNVTVIIEF